MKPKLIQTKDYLLLIDEEAEIEEWDFYYDSESKLVPIKQSIENSHKDFTGYKIIAYYSITKEAKELDLPLLPSPNTKKDINVEELACNIYGLSLDEYEYIKEDLSQNRELIEEHYRDIDREEIPKKYFDVLSFVCGYQAQQSKQFSLEDVKKAIEMAQSVKDYGDYKPYSEQEIIQSLITQQSPKEFIPIMVCGRCLKPDDNDEDCWSAKECSRNTDFPDTFKTITDSKGQKVVQGEYKYK